MKLAHFYDIDTLLIINSQPWIVSKSNPNIPIMKISQSDFNLCKSGIYKSQNNKIDFNDRVFWLSDDIMNKLKIKSKNSDVNLSNLSISMQEFLNVDLISNIDYDINMNVVSHIKNTNDDIYIICSKNSKKSYDAMITKMEEKMAKIGLVIKSYYFISETFYHRNNDTVSFKKDRLLLQHLIGFKTDNDKFTGEEIEKYDEIYYYDEDKHTNNLVKDSNKIFQLLLSNTDSIIKSKIKDIIKSNDHVIYINEVSPNKKNKLITSKVIIEWSNLIKAFEGFKFK